MAIPLESTAYHEAGHAVMFLEARRRFKYVTIIEPEGAVGHIQWNLGVAKPESLIDSAARFNIERIIVALLAGPAAEERYSGKHRWVGARCDLERATDFAMSLYPHEAVASRYLEYLVERAKWEVSRPINWLGIEAIANALLEKRTLTYGQVCSIIRRGHEMPEEQRNRLYAKAA